MNTAITAKFSIEAPRLRRIVEAFDNSCDSISCVRVVEDRTSLGHSVITGPSQDVMFIIGAVAAQGEAALVSAEAHPMLPTVGQVREAFEANTLD